MPNPETWESESQEEPQRLISMEESHVLQEPRVGWQSVEGPSPSRHPALLCGSPASSGGQE